MLKSFILSNWEPIVSVFALLISLFNFIYLIHSNFKRLNCNVINFTTANIENKTFYMFNVEFINKSRLPISVISISFKDDLSSYNNIKSPRVLAECDRRRNKELVWHKEVKSAKFPINIDSLSSFQCFFAFYGPSDYEKLNRAVTINTNRGVIKKKIYLNNYYMDKTEFMKETSEYYD